jgi:hypothetical protein
MNAKVANVIALELGILIAIMAWLAFSRLPSVRQPRVAEDQARVVGSFATITPELKAMNQRLHAADYRADRDAGKQEDEEQASTPRQYDQEIATAPSASSDIDDDVTTGSSSYYAGANQQPAANSSDYLVSPLDQIVAYAQPTEIIIFTNARSFGRQPRLTTRFSGARLMVAHRRPGGGESHVRGGGFVLRRNTNARSFSQSQGLRARSNR